MANKKILVVVAHPDDETLGMGASIRKFTEWGDEVSVLSLTDGCASRLSSAELMEVRYGGQYQVDENKSDEFSTACAMLGVNQAAILEYVDQTLDSYPRVVLVKDVERVLEAINPDIVYTHNENDLNLDHTITAQVVEVATRPMGNHNVTEVYSFSIPESTMVSTGGYSANPKIYEELSENHVSSKIAALSRYQSERVEDPNHPRHVDNVKMQLAVDGKRIGKGFAEPFQLIRKVNSLV